MLMKNPRKPPAVQPPPHIPGLTPQMVKDHAAKLFRDVFPEQPLTESQWRLVEEDLARKLEHDGL